DSLAREVHLSFNYCESQLGTSVQKIYLTGGTAKFKGIDKVLNSMIGVDVEIWDSTRNLQFGASLPKDQLTTIGPLLTVSVGLALRGM
ncbi:MAG: pilus assembly protein PilM, partial [Candidatus Omnitrophica bacterium]|nr:pilus assembly protein PilM [Candidatus Omnitrophota bacterium]